MAGKLAVISIAIAAGIGIAVVAGMSLLEPVADVTPPATDNDSIRESVIGSLLEPVADVTPPTITPPADVYVGAAATLTALSQLGAAHVVDDDTDSSPAVTNDAPDMFPIGRTTITWNATDKSGNWATATQLVTVQADDFDSNWYYVLEWEPGAWGYAAIAATKHLDNLLLMPSDVGHGEIHLYKTFRTADIINRSITIKSDTYTPHSVTVYVMDGVYSGNVQSDLAAAAKPIPKGGGILAAYEISEMPESFKPDWTRSQLDETTLVISLEKRIPLSGFQIESVEFEGHSKWVFDDYKANQMNNGGMYMLLPTRASTYSLPVSDTFDSSLDGWTYWGYTADYIFRHDATTGNPSPSAFINMDQFNVFSGMSKIVDISGMQDGQRLMLSYDYRAASDTSLPERTNSYLRVLDADTGKVLFHTIPVFGGIMDTGWRSYSTDLTDETAGSDRIEIVLGFHDSWVAEWDQRNWYDNVAVYAKPSK